MKITSDDILNGPVGPILARMTGPLVMGITMMILFELVDTYFVSLLDTAELAAISFTFPVTFTLLNFSIGFSVATSVLLASAIGQGNLSYAGRISTDSILLSTLILIVISLIGLVTVDPLFQWLGATEKTLPLIHDYIDIWYSAAGLLALLVVSNGALRATGDTKTPTMIMMLSGFLNAVLDPVFIFGFGPVPELGVKGAAIASALSWLVSSAVMIWVLWRREKLLVLCLPWR